MRSSAFFGPRCTYQLFHLSSTDGVSETGRVNDGSVALQNIPSTLALAGACNSVSYIVFRSSTKAASPGVTVRDEFLARPSRIDFTPPAIFGLRSKEACSHAMALL